MPRDAALVAAVPIHQVDLEVAVAVRGERDPREEHGRLAVRHPHEVVGDDVGHARQRTLRAVIALAERLLPGGVDEARVDDVALLLGFDRREENELRVDALGQLRVDRHVRRIRREGEDARGREVARERREERRVVRLQRQRRVGTRHDDGDRFRRLIRPDRRRDLRLRERARGDEREK